jgi:hypothetical protein
MLHPTRSPANWPLLGISSRINAEARFRQTVSWTGLLRNIRWRLVPDQVSGRIPSSGIVAALELAGFPTRNAYDLGSMTRVLRGAGVRGLESADIAALLRNGTANVDYETVSRTLHDALGMYIRRIRVEARHCDSGLSVWRSPGRRAHVSVADRAVAWSIALPDPRFLEWDWARLTVAFAALERTASELLACLVVFVALTTAARSALKKEPVAVAAGAAAESGLMVASGESTVTPRMNALPAAAARSLLSRNGLYEEIALSMATVDKTADRIRLPFSSRTPIEAE